MLSLFAQNRLPQIRLPRGNGSDLVFQGLLLAAAENAPGTAYSGRSTLALYKTLVGKFVLSSVSGTNRPEDPAPARAVCFTCLADVRTYLSTEHPGQEDMVDASVLRAREKPDHCDWFGPGTYAAGLDCAWCPESDNCTGRRYRPAGTT